jgi:hypothetical protein
MRVGHVEAHGDHEADKTEHEGQNGEGPIRRQQEDIRRRFGKAPAQCRQPEDRGEDRQGDQRHGEGHPGTTDSRQKGTGPAVAAVAVRVCGALRSNIADTEMPNCPARKPNMMASAMEGATIRRFSVK